ncbi:hypothetical protein J1N35_001199 [Gossypium stocksii]|uniref:Uncharacterized protein n=1 Tax=Gossypium stocksii TaxID=47602 RepID=A0A9D3WIX4_9ROSI|nr:hypothetical protein J1N35_001199 [Gossypium stocksii]
MPSYVPSSFGGAKGRSFGGRKRPRGSTSNSHTATSAPTVNIDVLALLHEVRENEVATVALPRTVISKKAQTRPKVDRSTHYAEDSDRPQLAQHRLKKGLLLKEPTLLLFLPYLQLQHY